MLIDATRGSDRPPEEGNVCHRALFVAEEFENKLGIIRDVELLQQHQVFALETLPCMMLLLVKDVPNH